MHDCLEKVVRPALLLVELDSAEAEINVLAIGAQESELVFTRQLGEGPARGYWMDEIEGVEDVFRHSHSSERAIAFCKTQGVEPNAQAVYDALENNPVLAAGIARLKLATNPAPLSADEQTAWTLYMAVWRPGRPRPWDWSDNFRRAVETVKGVGNELVEDKA